MRLNAMDGKDEEARLDFLQAMYKAMWDNINRHVTVVWQSIAALVTAGAAVFLSDRQMLHPDAGAALVVLAAGWAIAQTLDANHWFERNLFIIGNIERELLHAEDATKIHPYFTTARKGGMVEHFVIQHVLACGITLLVVGRHFRSRVYPVTWTEFIWSARCVPYALAVLAILGIVALYCRGKRKMKKLRSAVPSTACSTSS